MSNTEQAPSSSGSLQVKLEGALNSYLNGHWSQDDFQSLLALEIQAAEKTQSLAPEGELGEGLTQALEVYLICLDELAELVERQADLDSDSLAQILAQAGEADLLLDSLSSDQSDCIFELI